MRIMRIVALLLMLLAFTGTAHAKDINSVKMSPGVQAIGYAEADMRGEFLAEGALAISNLGNGYIGIFTQTLTHKPVDKMRVRVYLDILDKETQQWANVSYYDFTYLKEDFTNGDLSDPYEEFMVLGKKNNHYRLRGIHMVWLNGETESFNTETDGLLITR